MNLPEYATDPLDARTLTPLDSLSALYHRRSGITHLVSEPVPEILAALADGPATVNALTARLSEAYGLVADADTQAILAERLNELEAIGLVWRI